LTAKSEGSGGPCGLLCRSRGTHWWKVPRVQEALALTVLASIGPWQNGRRKPVSCCDRRCLPAGSPGSGRPNKPTRVSPHSVGRRTARGEVVGGWLALRQQRYHPGPEMPETAIWCRMAARQCLRKRDSAQAVLAVGRAKASGLGVEGVAGARDNRIGCNDWREVSRSHGRRRLVRFRWCEPASPRGTVPDEAGLKGLPNGCSGSAEDVDRVRRWPLR